MASTPPVSSEPQPQAEGSNTSHATNSETPSNFSAALASWRDINLAELQKTLDGQGIEIVSNQKENMVGRKKLAEQTREFKKQPDEEKLAAFKGLLKAYQSEIDSLTKRSKMAENSFLSVYKVLAEAPDPFPLLDAAIDQTARASEARLLEAQLARERSEVSALRTQLSEAQQADKERSKLADKVQQLEAKLEDRVAERVANKESELHATYDERLRNYADRERDLSKQVEMAREQLRDLRSSNESTHAKLLDHNQRIDQDTAARRAETELLLADVERANSRVAAMERRNEALRAEVESARSGTEGQNRIQELEVQTGDLQTEITRLLRTIEEQQQAAQDAQRQQSKKVEDTEHRLQAQTAEITLLKDKQARFADYDEIKRELDIIKYIEFAGVNLDEEAPEESEDASSMADSASLRMPDPNAAHNTGRGKPLENLLLTKNRKVQEQLTTLRVAHEELQTRTDTLAKETEELKLSLEAQKSLNNRLENDLLKLNGPAGGTGKPPSPQPQERKDPLASLNLGKKDTVAPGLSPAAETSILPIVTSQRDRFRSRNAELEEELRKHGSTTSELRTEIKALQADNVKLYEKVRYLQSYDNAAAGSSASSKTLYPPAKPKAKDDDLSKYQNMYEQSMNPFEAFRGRERTSAMAALNPVERILLGLSNTILGHRALRGAFVLYAFALHFFVFLTLWSYSSSSASPQPITYQQPPPPGQR